MTRSEHEADVAPPESVRRDAGEDRSLSGLRTELVGPPESGLNDSVDVLSVAPTACLRREGRSVLIDWMKSSTVRVELVEQPRHDVDDPHAGPGLGLADVDPTPVNVDV